MAKSPENARPGRHRPLALAAIAFLPLIAASALLTFRPSFAQGPGAIPTPVLPPWRQELVPRPRPLTVDVGGIPVAVEVANTDRERGLGLGDRDFLAPGTGMLFVFDERAQHRFTMAPMRFCLDIIWVDAGQVVGAAQSTCPSPDAQGPTHASPGPVEYVLEVPAGFLAENGLGIGAPVTFSVDPASIGTPVPAGAPTQQP